MKIRFILFTAMCLLLTVTGAVFADETLFNPSVYTAGEIAGQMPDYWLANYIEIQELMNAHPDFSCQHYDNDINGEKFDQLICSSVNNSRARDVIINFDFTGDHAGMTGLQQAVFTVATPSSEDIQSCLETFWISGAIPSHNGSDWFYGQYTSLYFTLPGTVLRFDLPLFTAEGDHYVTVDIRDANAGPMGVG